MYRADLGWSGCPWAVIKPLISGRKIHSILKGTAETSWPERNYKSWHPSTSRKLGVYFCFKGKEWEFTAFFKVITHIHMLLAALQLLVFDLGPHLPLALWYLFHRLLPKCFVGYAGKHKLVKETTLWFTVTQGILPLSLLGHTQRMTFGFCWEK